MVIKARSARSKGNRLEKWLVTFCEQLGLRARKQPGSGVYSAFPHDVSVQIAGQEYIAECKSWKHGWRTGDAALGQADFLVIKRDYGSPCFYVPETTMQRWVQLFVELEELRARS